jgi:hypothetical protein
MVLAAYEASTPRDREGMAFVVDCDFEVPLKKLISGPSIVISRNADFEADLLDLGLFEHIVSDAVPSLVSNPERIDDVAATVRERVLEIVQILGQVRRVAMPRGIDLEHFNKLNYRRWRAKGSTALNPRIMIEKLGQGLHPSFCGLSRDEFHEEVVSLPTGYQYCNGHDLIYAMEFILSADFKSKKTRGEIENLLRGSAGEIFWEWSVPQRIRRWEAKTGRMVLRV